MSRTAKTELGRLLKARSGRSLEALGEEIGVKDLPAKIRGVQNSGKLLDSEVIEKIVQRLELGRAGHALLLRMMLVDAGYAPGHDDGDDAAADEQAFLEAYRALAPGTRSAARETMKILSGLEPRSDTSRDGRPPEGGRLSQGSAVRRQASARREPE